MKLKVMDRYIFMMLVTATVLIAVILASIIFLTQSMRFLELVMNSGASTTAFWMLTVLALPRFFEIILPIALMAGTIFVYNKMVVDSELVVMRAVGTTPWRMARPALILSLIIGVVLYVMMAWLGPKSLSDMHNLRQIVKAHYSSLLLRKGIFNEIDDGLTVFIRDKSSEGELQGLLIHDNREADKPEVTIIARRGVFVKTEQGQEVIVYEGSRQEIDHESGALNRLDFSRYTIDLPDGSGDVRQRWREPDERTLWELFHPDPENRFDVKHKRDFFVEINRRLISPLLAINYTIITLSILLLGPIHRHGQGMRIAAAILSVMIIQGLYLVAYSAAGDSNAGLVAMYILVFAPLLTGAFMLSRFGEKFRQRLLFNVAAVRGRSSS